MSGPKDRVALDEFSRKRLWRAVQRVGLTVARDMFGVSSWTLDKLLLGYRCRPATVERVRAQITEVSAMPPGRAFRAAARRTKVAP